MSFPGMILYNVYKYFSFDLVFHSFNTSPVSELLLEEFEYRKMNLLSKKKAYTLLYLSFNLVFLG